MKLTKITEKGFKCFGIFKQNSELLENVHNISEFFYKVLRNLLQVFFKLPTFTQNFISFLFEGFISLSLRSSKKLNSYFLIDESTILEKKRKKIQTDYYCKHPLIIIISLFIVLCNSLTGEKKRPHMT